MSIGTSLKWEPNLIDRVVASYLDSGGRPENVVRDRDGKIVGIDDGWPADPGPVSPDWRAGVAEDDKPEPSVEPETWRDRAIKDPLF